MHQAGAREKVRWTYRTARVVSDPKPGESLASVHGSSKLCDMILFACCAHDQHDQLKLKLEIFHNRLHIRDSLQEQENAKRRPE